MAVNIRALDEQVDRCLTGQLSQMDIEAPLSSRGQRLPVAAWDISRLHERRLSSAVAFDTVEGIASRVGDIAGCYVDPTECASAVELLFWALIVDGWKLIPPQCGIGSCRRAQ